MELTNKMSKNSHTITLKLTKSMGKNCNFFGVLTYSYLKQTTLLAITLKDELSCMIVNNIEASSDLLKSIDNLLDTISRRLELSEKSLRLILKRNAISEPVQFLWYQL